jgi:hypothetical protein
MHVALSYHGTEHCELITAGQQATSGVIIAKLRLLTGHQHASLGLLNSSHTARAWPVAYV